MPAPANHAGRTREDRVFLSAPVTSAEKRAAERKAKALRLPLAELIRRAVEAYDPKALDPST